MIALLDQIYKPLTDIVFIQMIKKTDTLLKKDVTDYTNLKRSSRQTRTKVVLYNKVISMWQSV